MLLYFYGMRQVFYCAELRTLYDVAGSASQADFIVINRDEQRLRGSAIF